MSDQGQQAPTQSHHGSKKINGQDMESRLAKLPNYWTPPEVPELKAVPGQNLMAIGKPSWGDLNILDDSRNEYVWHLSNGYQFGLKGIIGWTVVGDHFVFFDDKGVAMVLDKGMNGCFRPYEGDGTISLDPTKKANTGNPPQSARDETIREGKEQSRRYILRVRADKTLEVFDNYSEQSLGFTQDTPKEAIQSLVEEMNLGYEARSGKEFLDTQEKAASVSIYIIDGEEQPSAMLSQQTFSEMIQSKIYRWTNAPVVVDQQGQHFRVFEQDKVVRLIRASMDIRAPKNLETGHLS